MNLPHKCCLCGSPVYIKEAVGYDGAEDAGWARIIGDGDTPQAAADEWSFNQEEEIQ